MTNVKTLMHQDPGGAELVMFAHQTAKALVRENLTRAQIRNIFTEARKIEALWDVNPEDALRRLTMLKPKLAYAEARKNSVKELRRVLSEAIDEVHSAADADRKRIFERFMNLFEAILAYHRAEGGKD